MRTYLAIALTCMLSIMYGCSERVSRITGNAAALLVSDAEEVELGNKFKAEILADVNTYPQYTKNPEINRYIDSIGQAIAKAQKDRENISYTFTVINDDTTINAFAIPGGHVFIYTGLIRAMKNEAELAGVIAHEIAHITNRHGIKTMVQMYGLSYVLNLLIDGDNQIAALVTNLATSLVFLDYGRDNEFQADSCAVEYSTLTGYNPTGMKTFLQKLESLSGGSVSGGVTKYFSTHPPAGERVSRVDAIITRNGSNLTEELLYAQRFLQMQSKL